MKYGGENKIMLKFDLTLQYRTLFISQHPLLDKFFFVLHFKVGQRIFLDKSLPWPCMVRAARERSLGVPSARLFNLLPKHLKRRIQEISFYSRINLIFYWQKSLTSLPTQGWLGLLTLIVF